MILEADRELAQLTDPEEPAGAWAGYVRVKSRAVSTQLAYGESPRVCPHSLRYDAIPARCSLCIEANGAAFPIVRTLADRFEPKSTTTIAPSVIDFREKISHAVDALDAHRGAS